MAEWDALGLGRSALGPQRPTVGDGDVVLDFLARQVEGTSSLGSRMTELRRMRTPPPGETASGPPMPGTPEYDLAMDIAGNFNLTGKVGDVFSPKKFMGGDIGEIVVGRDIPELPKGGPAGQVAGELFDLGRLDDLSTYPRGLQPPREMVRPRVPPRAGIPQNVTDVMTPENAAKMREDVLEGVKLGGAEWYNTGPFRQKLVDALGEQEGDRRWRLFMQSVAATSPRTGVPQNIRNASFYYNKALKGEVPDPVENSRVSAIRRQLSGEADYEKAVEAAKAAGKKPKFLEATEDWPALPVPSPYGSLTQINNMKMMKEIMDTGQIKNPLKPASFGENLLGNLDPLTADVHFTRWLGLKDPKDSNKFLEMPEAGHYGTIEDWFRQNVMDPLELPSAVGQASGWLGQGAKTGLRSPVEPFMATVEKMVGRTADILGVSKEQVWNDVFVKGKYPLLGVGGVATAGQDDD